MSKLDLRKQYLQLAYDQLNPKENTLKALEQVLTNWFCLKFSTTPNDERLLNMRLDELLLFRMMHEIHDRPSVIEEIGPQRDEFEEWLRKEMGEDYKSMDQEIQQAEKLEAEEKAIADTLPDKIETDFNAVQGK